MPLLYSGPFKTGPTFFSFSSILNLRQQRRVPLLI